MLCFFRFAITSQSKYFTPTKFQNQFTINSNYYALKSLVKILKQPSIKPALNCIFCRKIIKLSGFFTNLENALNNGNYCIIHRKPPCAHKKVSELFTSLRLECNTFSRSMKKISSFVNYYFFNIIVLGVTAFFACLFNY